MTCESVYSVLEALRVSGGAIDAFEAIEPPDDSGSSTFGRYEYQAEVAFVWVLACALGQGVQAVFLEHVEDIAFVDDGGLHLLQVKTRDQGYGAWSLSDILKEGGGCDSLFRSYRALKEAEVDASLTLVLEGALKNGDAINDISLPELPEALVKRVIQGLRKLKPTEDEVREFLGKLRVAGNNRTRGVITDSNLRLIAEGNPRIGIEEQRRIYDDFMTIINDAMRGSLGNSWPTELVNKVHGPLESGAAHKRIDEDRLQPIAASLPRVDRPLLRLRQPDPLAPVSDLVEKMLLGLATPPLIEDAKQLRATAVDRELELFASGRIEEETDALLEDLRARLLFIADGIVAKHCEEDKPAACIWLALNEYLARNAATTDPENLFRGDGVLLLGEVCELSDQCYVGWGG